MIIRDGTNIHYPDSETPWLITQGIGFIDSHDDTPWLCHLPYIKPHCPYIVPAPYNTLYTAQDVTPTNRALSERVDAHPVYAAFMGNQVGQAFARDEVRETVIPAYMGLIAQCDDQIGRLFDYMQATSRMDDTMIILTLDHGDYLGDLWMGERDLFHDPSVRIPLIIYDPSAPTSTHGTTSDAWVESINLAPTFVEAMGGAPAGHILEGRSLMPLIHSQHPEDWRKIVFSEYDYSGMSLAGHLGLSPDAVRSGQRSARAVRSGACPDHADQIRRLYGLLNDWARRPA